jgi:hypothetical protein
VSPPVRFGRSGALRADSRAEEPTRLDDGEAGTEIAASAPAHPSPSSGSVSLSTERRRRVDRAAAVWRGRLLELGGESALADITLLDAAAIDLSAAHPSGLAQLFAGRPTLLSNLVREGGSLATARRRSRIVLARADDLAQRYGIAPTYLAIGVGSWALEEPPAGGGPAPAAGELATGGPARGAGSEAPGPEAEPGGPAAVARTVNAPLLLRPVRLSAHAESEIELLLEPAVEVNPVVLRALRAAGLRVDGAALARETVGEYGFSPRTALAHLRDLGEQALPGFRFAERLVLGPFVHPGQLLVEDLEDLRGALPEHEVVAALAADPEALDEVRRPLPPFVAADRPPETERGVGDLDPTQQHVLDAVASGAHLFVDAPPGADAAATAAAILADTAAAGRHAVYVSGTRRAGRGVTDVLDAHGLGELVLDLSADARWGAEAGARLATGARITPPAIDQAAVSRLRAELVDARRRLSAYIAALHHRREPWGVSAHDALQSLAGLTARPDGPRTRVRLAAPAARELHGERRDAVRAELVRAAGLGAFAVRPGDTPWFGAPLTDADAARGAFEHVRRLSEDLLPALRRRLTAVGAQTGLARAHSVREWGQQLAMLDGVRAALDVFQPVIFERSAEDLAAATATRAWRAEHGVAMPWRVRRRLRRQARDMLRPGRPVPDLHAALLHVEARRAEWRRHCPDGEWPRLPEGLAPSVREYRAIVAELDALEPVLASTEGGGDLAGAPLADLEARLRRLAADEAALESLPARTAALGRLGELGLDELATDLAERRVPAGAVGEELELAWWSSVFEQILRADPALAGYDASALGALADHLRELDAAQVDSLPAPVLAAVAGKVRAALLADPGVREQLADLAAERVRDVADAVARLGRLAGVLRPCWLVAPMQVPRLLAPRRDVDLLVLDAAQHLPVEQALAAIARARQVVVVGDSRRSSLNAPGATLSVVDALAAVLPRITLAADRVMREPGLMAFLGEHGYADVVRSVPRPARRPAVRLDLVEGQGVPLTEADLVESPQGEVDHVARLVVEHALSRPEETLAVLTLTVRHADRVREAVRTAVADSAALRNFVAPDRHEPFAVLDLEAAAGVRRDAVILSLGLGTTPHGRVMHRFGRVSDPDGAGLVIDAIDACRRRLTVVSCFAPAELDRRRLRAPGPALLADLLDAAEAGAALPATVAEQGEPDPLLVDLAARLVQLGLTVVPRFGIPGGVRVPLAIGHPDAPDDLLVAVLTDDADYVAQPSLRIRDRHDVQRLAERGWGVHMAFSPAVFLDPQAEAEAILAAVRAGLRGRGVGPQAPSAPPAEAGTRGSASEGAPLEVPAHWEDDDADVAPLLPALDAEALREVPSGWAEFFLADDAGPAQLANDEAGQGEGGGVAEDRASASGAGSEPPVPEASAEATAPDGRG